MIQGKRASKKIVVGMSGGVDSSAAAAILVGQGWEVIGVTLQTWKETGEVERPWLDRSCCKVGLARHVAERLKIPHHVVDAQQTFRSLVIRDFLKEYATGRTPNPCVVCNEKVKFGVLLDIALELGADYLATGHYARVERSSTTGRVVLKKGVDEQKDQSYFLYRLSQGQLSRVQFPLGGLQKSQVWEAAEEMGFPVDEVAESQELCFVTEGDYRAFLKAEIPHVFEEGQIVNRLGKVVGHHQGVALYTIGQRKGLNLSPETEKLEGRVYVTELDPVQNKVVVGSGEDLEQRYLKADQVNLLQSLGTEGQPWYSVSAKVRYRAGEAGALARILEGNRLEVVFHNPQRAITPGQSVVMYRGDEVIGGGIIKQVGRDTP